MPTLLLTPRTDIPDTFRLGAAATAMGWRVERSTSYSPAKTVEHEACVLYGETLFTTLAAKALGLVVLEPTFNMLAFISEQYLKRTVQSMILAEAQKLTTPRFIKPADGSKAFEAQVYKNGLELPARYLAKQMPVLLSEPVQWAVEYRFFIFEREIATFSVYARCGDLARDENGEWPAPQPEIDEAVNFCSTILQDESVKWPAAFVLDIGRIESRGWAIVEPNPAPSSGIYGCQPEQVLQVIQQACIRQECLATTDLIWAVNRPI